MKHLNPGNCRTCGRALAAGQRFCAHCGAERPAQLGPDGLAWEADVSLLTNPLILRQLATVLGLAGLLLFGLLALLFAVEDEWEQIPMALMMTLVGVGATALLLVLVMLLFFGNRFRARFAVNEAGVVFESVDRRAIVGSRLAVLLGMLRGAPSVAGAGLAATAGGREAHSWRRIVRAGYHPRWYGITLHNRWRTVAFLACTPGNYEQVAAFVRQKVSASSAEARASEPSPLPRLLARSALVVLAALPVFLLPHPFDLDLLLPLIMLCFALATVWLVPLFGWVVMAVALWIAGEILLIALRTRESVFPWHDTYRTYEILETGDWLALALAAAGLAYLAASGWRAARGHAPSALSADEMED